MDPIKLLLVEDDDAYSFILKGCLELTGEYEVYTASNGKEGLEAYFTYSPDVIVSDIEMPIMSGVEMVKAIRQIDTKILLIFASARTSAQDLISGLNLGVDTYIRKPFLPEELNAHIQAILKRSELKSRTEAETQKIYHQLGNYFFNFDSRIIQWKDKQISITEREAKILWKLYEQKGQVVRRDDILLDLWGAKDFFASRSLDVFVHNLRKYFEQDSSVEIQTVRGEGLRLIL